MTGAQLFDDLMRFKPDGLTANGWAVKAGVSRTIWADLRRHGNPSRRTLEKLLAAAGSSLAEFEALRVGRAGHLPAPAAFGDWPRAVAAGALRRSPRSRCSTLAWPANGAKRAAAIEFMRSTDPGRWQVDRPSAWPPMRDAYAVTIVGESMWPRFRAGPATAGFAGGAGRDRRRCPGTAGRADKAG